MAEKGREIGRERGEGKDREERGREVEKREGEREGERERGGREEGGRYHESYTETYKPTLFKADCNSIPVLYYLNKCSVSYLTVKGTNMRRQVHV